MILGRTAPPRDDKSDAGTGRADRKESRKTFPRGRRAAHGGGRPARVPDTRTPREHRRDSDPGQARREKKKIPPHVIIRVPLARKTHGVGATTTRAVLRIPGLSHSMTCSILKGHGVSDGSGRRARRVP